MSGERKSRCQVSGASRGSDEWRVEEQVPGVRFQVPAKAVASDERRSRCQVSGASKGSGE
jgi:hypothetical protein